MDARVESSAAGGDRSLTCAQALRLIELSAETQLPARVAAALRGHLEICSECVAAPVVRGSGKRESAPLERRREERPRRTPLWRPVLHRRRLLAFRFALVCAILFAVSQLFGDFRRDPTIAVSHLAGEVWVGGIQVDPGDEQRAWRSDLIETGAASRARLSGPDLKLELAPFGELLMESAMARRMRLLSGELELAGNLSLYTAQGIVECERATARIALEAGTLRIECDAGSVTLTTADGVERLGPGDRTQRPRRVAQRAPR